jgi:Protein of unknown function (DUF1566)
VITTRKKIKSAITACCLQAVSFHAHSICRADLNIDTPNNRFIVDSNGTVTDIKTKLIWKRCAEGLTGPACDTGVLQSYNWKDALSVSAISSYNGFTDWRVPNIKELESIVERSCYNPSINEMVFPNTPSSRFWSSSAAVDRSGQGSGAWEVLFANGVGSYQLMNISSQYSVRLVRGGQ